MTGRRAIVILLAAFLLFSGTAHAAGTVPVIVKLGPAANLPLITNLLNGTVIDSIPEANIYLLRVPVLPVLTPFLRLVGVEWLELDRGVQLSTRGPLGLDVPWDRGSDWYRHQPSLNLIRAGRALEYSTGRGIIIADINSSVDYGHPALRGHLGPGYDFVSSRSADQAALDDEQSTSGFLDDEQSTSGFLDDDQSTSGFLDGNGVRLLDRITRHLKGAGSASHGTFCAGILAVMAPDATIMPLRAFDDEGNSDVFTLAKAIRYARRNGAQVLNMSFGTLTDSRVLREAIQYARDGNVVLIASAGNTNTSAPQYPAAYPGVIAVAATDIHDVKAPFSNYGRSIFVDAPGKNIISALPGGTYGMSDGTSFSAPMVSAMAALIRSQRYTGTSSTIAQSVVPIDRLNPEYSYQLGYGRIDVLKAVLSGR